MKRFALNGYEVIAGGDEITLIDRKTWGLGVLMIVLGSWAALLVFASVLYYTVGDMGVRSEILGIALPGGAGLLVVIVWIISREYRVRRDQSVEEIQDTLVVDLSTQVLRSQLGGAVAQLASVKARMHIDWWTRGTMRLVVLSWPGGRRTIYRTFGRRRSLELLAFLKDQGLDAL